MDLRKDCNIVFSGLKLGNHQYDFTFNKSFFLEYDFNEFNNINVDVIVIMEKKENMLVFNFEIKGSIVTECDRCAEDLEIKIEGKNIHFMNFSEEKTEMNDDDISNLNANAYEVNISDLIYEYIIILIPTKRVHINNKACESILDEFSILTEDENISETDENIDPRWEALKNLK